MKISHVNVLGAHR